MELRFGGLVGCFLAVGSPVIWAGYWTLNERPAITGWYDA